MGLQKTCLPPQARVGPRRKRASITRRTRLLIAAGLTTTLLAGCGEEKRVARPVFYTELASAEARVDAASARDIFNAYRRNLSLAPLTLDDGLMREAQVKADASAAAGSVADGSRGAGRAKSGTLEILSAGYYTISDAFSGWRGSPSHDAKLRAANVRRLGIATAYASDSKYKVYWAVILAP